MTTFAVSENSEQPGTKRSLIAMVILALVFLALSLSKFDHFQFGVYMDDAHYIAIARSLAAGNGYAYPHIPDTVHFPPSFPIGYPLTLAPVLAIFSNSLEPLKIHSLVFTLINGLLIYRFWPGWTRSSVWWGVAIAGSYWLHGMVVGHTRMVMSEPISLTMYLLLVAVVAYYQEGQRRWWSWPAIGLLALALITTRTIGLAIVVGVVLSFLLQGLREWSWRRLAWGAVISVVSLVVIGVLLVKIGIIPERYWTEYNSRYLRGLVVLVQGELETESVNQEESLEIGDLSEDYFVKIWRHIRSDIPAAILNASPIAAVRIDNRLPVPFARDLLGISVLFFLILGSLRWVRQVGWHVLWISGLAYGGALLVWNWSNVRLLYLIEPHLIFAFYLGCFSLLKFILGDRRGPFGKSLPELILLGLVVFLLIINVPLNALAAESIPHVGDLTVRTSWLNENTGKDQIIMSEYPQVDYLYLPRKIVKWPNADSAGKLNTYLLENEVDYLLLAPQIEWDSRGYQPNWSKKMTKMMPLVETLEAQAQVKLLYEDQKENLQVFQVIKD